MKFSRSSKKVAHEDGRLIYRRKQSLPVRLKFREFTAVLHNDASRLRPHHLQITNNGDLIVDMHFVDGDELTLAFDPPLVMARGPIEVRVVCTGFDPNEEINASVTVNYSLALFG